MCFQFIYLFFVVVISVFHSSPHRYYHHPFSTNVKCHVFQLACFVFRSLLRPKDLSVCFSGFSMCCLLLLAFWYQDSNWERVAYPTFILFRFVLFLLPFVFCFLSLSTAITTVLTTLKSSNSFLFSCQMRSKSNLLRPQKAPNEGLSRFITLPQMILLICSNFFFFLKPAMPHVARACFCAFFFFFFFLTWVPHC
jgi:hypothetical protein